MTNIYINKHIVITLFNDEAKSVESVDFHA